MPTWCIHEASREWVREFGNFCLERVEAATKEDAERASRASTMTGRWAVAWGPNHQEVRLG